MNNRFRCNLLIIIHLGIVQVDSLTTVKVCTNKDCLKRFPSSNGDNGLVQMLHDLVTPEDKRAIQIEPSGCLDKCGNGPNVCIKSSGGHEQMFGRVEDLSTASAIMEVGAEIDCPIPLMVAVQGMAKAALVQDAMKRVNALDGIIHDLCKSQAFSKSASLSHALILRADAYMEIQPSNLEQARHDINQALEIISSVEGVVSNTSISSEALVGRAWRIKANIEEKSGNILEAMAAVSKWAESSPMFRTKAKRELSRLSSTRGSFGGNNSNNMNP